MMELLTDALAGKPHDIFYIIDDLHFLPNPAFTSLILFLSDHLPERTHIILLSRNVIFDRAAQMKLGPRLWELNVDDLRLGETDVREYARRGGQLLNIRDVNMLASSTEGWFSMVYLKLRAYAQTGKWPENTTNIYPLIDEVLFRPLAARQREFLVRLGVPDDFTMEEAEFLWPEGDTAALLSQLTEQNAFITCTDGVYRYHNMLRSCARKKFILLPETEQNTTLIRLGQWYEKTGECCFAAECYEKTGNWDDLLRTVGQDRGLSFGPERLPLVRRWMANCPEECQLRHPQALLVFMLLLFYGRDIPEMQRYHALFQRSMALCTDLSKQERNQLEGEALLRLSFLCFNDISAMSAYHRQIRVTCDGAEAVYELNDSAAADALYAQLPLTLPVENFSTNEKVFYPPDALDTSDTPLASGGAGTLAYYAPWGDVVLFYDEYSGNPSLYELGRIVSGGELVSGFSGEITVEAVE